MTEDLSMSYSFGFINDSDLSAENRNSTAFGITVGMWPEVGLYLKSSNGVDIRENGVVVMVVPDDHSSLMSARKLRTPNERSRLDHKSTVR